MVDQEIERTGSPFWSGSGYYQNQAVLGRTSSSESATSSTGGTTRMNRGVKKTWTVVFFLVFSILLLLFLSSFRSMAFRPTMVKSGWESLNIAFLLFAIICGFLGRNKVDDAGSGSGKVVQSPPYTPRLKRSSSSYPDLKEPQQWSFSDDLGLCGRERKWDAACVDRTEEEEEIESMVVDRNLRDSDFENVRVDFVPPNLPTVKRINVESPQDKKKKKIRSPSPPPPPPLPRPTLPRRRTSEGSKVVEKKKNIDAPLSFPPMPPPSPPPPPPATERKEKRIQRKRSGGKKDIATAIAAYYQKKRKRNGNGNSSKGKRSYEEFLQTSVPSQPPPPPPPPPPLLQKSALYHFFRNKKEMMISTTKSKRIYSNTQPPSATTTTTTSLPRPSTSQIITVHRPPLPPPPPPRRNISPEIASVPLSPEPVPFCPSPDVNNKADIFIARLHAGWRLEKLKSIKEKENQQQ